MYVGEENPESICGMLLSSVKAFTSIISFPGGMAPQLYILGVTRVEF